MFVVFEQENKLSNLLQSVKNKSFTETATLAKKIYSLIDLTSLNETDNTNTIDVLCSKAQGPLGQVAAVCIYPQFVEQAAKTLSHSAVKIATVVNFPHGMDSLKNVLKQIDSSIQNGAHEIDVVFPYTQYLAGNKRIACEFIEACKKACGETILLKVILETGAIPHLALITDMSRDVLSAGADFLKTSTGKIPVGATLEAAAVMLFAIKEEPSRGFKAAGGIRTFAQAMQYIFLAEQIMMPEWVTPRHFRLGASQLVDALASGASSTLRRDA